MEVLCGMLMCFISIGPSVLFFFSLTLCSCIAYSSFSFLFLCHHPMFLFHVVMVDSDSILCHACNVLQRILSRFLDPRTAGHAQVLDSA